ncbi:hypothetical protein Pmani_001677 [Petrolisthes manimaculis]|uniref:Structural maintenance of chromosomes protein n=1 Tax=Petrolisthes manimaculis TaxID=1843537 RepID=A0AAE1QJK3_9EUCA|nr:hypothetical protein Pmani_001677 [Petrolisthes manimaculis]
MKVKLLTALEIKNFKSFRGVNRIDLLQPFSVVIGANGTGKSNFMDAISFVIGVKKSSLRVRRVSDLLHGASTGQPVSQSAYVTAELELEDGSVICFTRIIEGSTIHHKISDKTVNQNTYLMELQKLGINYKGRNFLVFQGEIEYIALQNAKETTAMFEELCGSGALKEEYDRKKAEMLATEVEIKSLVQKKKNAKKQCKELEECCVEVEYFQKLKEEHREKQVELNLFSLFYIKKYVEETGNKVEEKREDLQNRKVICEKAEKVLKEKKIEKTNLSLDMNSSVKTIQEMESEMKKKRISLIKVKEQLNERKKRLDSSCKFLTKAIEANSAHMEDIKELESELQEVEEKKAQFENQVSQDLETEGKSIELEEGQFREYQQLKHTATINAAQYQQELDSIKRKQKLHQDRLGNARRQISETQSKLNLKGEELRLAEKRCQNLSELIKETETCLNEKQRERKDLESEVRGRREEMEKINKQLESVICQLGNARVDEEEDAFKKRQREIVEKLKQFFPGVYDRLLNMCQPIHNRYNIAVTTVMGKYMETIVVDIERTAKQCIQYLNEQRLGRESFMPIKDIEVKPLKERLRCIKHPKNTKLLYDVLHFNMPEIKRVVLFSTGNTLVCETAEDASIIANGDYNCDVVALDGTRFHKNGSISGGMLDLVKKARKWGEKHLSHLQASKVKLIEELRQIRLQSNKESELTRVESKLSGIELKLKYSKVDKVSLTENIAQLRMDVTKLNEELNAAKLQVHEIEETLSEREDQLKDLEENIKSVEDEVFADFCESIGVDNIRQYEVQHLQAKADVAHKSLEYEAQKNRILNQLVYEKSRETQNTVARWEKIVKDGEEVLEQAKQAEQKQVQETDKAMKDLEKKRSEHQTKKTEVESKEKEMKKCHDEVDAITKDIMQGQRKIITMQHKIQEKKLERHSIIMQCKMHDLLLYMKRENREDIEVDSTDGTVPTLEYSSGLASEEVYEREARIEVDFKKLSKALRKLSSMDDVNNHQKNMKKKIDDLHTKIMFINNQGVDMKIEQRLILAKENKQEIGKEHDNALKRMKKAIMEFEKTKGIRHKRFMTFFNHVASGLDDIYKEIVQSSSAQAFLVPANPEEPYLDGISYSCIPAGKRFHPMSSFSGGERTLAALALLFGIHSYHPSPFFVLDEIDASLDNTNMKKVVSYIFKKKEHMQIIVISHKEEFYQYADCLVGLCLDPSCERLVSKFFSLSLGHLPLQRDEESSDSNATQV